MSVTAEADKAPAVSQVSPSGWYGVEECVPVFGRGLRTVRGILAGVAPQLRRPVPGQAGRPRYLYHYTAHPALLADYRARVPSAPEAVAADHVAVDAPAPAAAEGSGVESAGAGTAPDDLEIARLRLRAVNEYNARRALMSEQQAARETVADWRLPRRAKVLLQERLPRNYRRKIHDQVEVGGFSASTLRAWASRLATGEGDFLCLAPGRKCAHASAQVEIPPALLDVVAVAAVSTSRMSIVSALDYARRHWQGEFPKASVATWRRRILSRDPAKVAATLGKRGNAAFARDHSPDIERDWAKLRFNQLWQIDDVTEDFYAHSAAQPGRLIRPFAYAIIRVSTRQWVAAVTSETPITGAQVRSLVGLAMASKSGGIPEEFTFEWGTVACDEYLHGLLTDLGVKVHRPLMDGGKTHAGAFSDRGTGHWQSKAVEERAFRTHHNILAQVPGQTGPDERHTAPANLETIKRQAMAEAKAGRPIILPGPRDWPGLIFGAFEAHNNRPTSALPLIMDDQGAQRHMSPNECAQWRVMEPLKVLPETALPLFFVRGEVVKVTRNGVRLNEYTYGRFDPDLQKLQGKSVLVFAMREYPHLAYIQELGRCVEVDAKALPDGIGGEFERKMHCDKAKRSKYQQMVDSALASGVPLIASMTWVCRNATPARAVAQADAQTLSARAAGMKTAAEDAEAVRKLLEQRFDAPSAPVQSPSVSDPAARPRRRGLLAREDELQAELAVLGGGRPAGVGDPVEKWEQLV